MHLLAVISANILADNVGVKLFELTKVLPRCVSRFDLVTVAYSIVEAHRVNVVHGHQKGFSVERLHEGLSVGVCEGCFSSSGLVSVEYLFVEAAEQLSFAQDV